MKELILKRLEETDIEKIQTEDNSYTLLHKELGVHYRSIHGANIESEHVFIQGTRILEEERWQVLELGFGLATNFRNLVQHLKEEQSLHYIALEHQPIPPEMIVGGDIGARLARKALEEARETSKTVIVSEGNIVLEL